MSVKNYRFVSPGVFVNEIDNSQLPASPAGIGPVIIGRAAKGPALRPTTVNSFEEFTRVFGLPASGDAGSDVWREGNNTSAPTYGAYAAQAYLRNSSPLTYIRLLGDQTTADGGPSETTGKAGWDVTKAYGLVVFSSGSTDYMYNVTGALAAIFYTNHADTKFELSGAIAEWDAVGNLGVAAASAVSGSGLVIAENDSIDKQFKALIKAADGDTTDEVVFNFNQNDSRYIRKVFNTNPQRANSDISNSPVYYWLGETFDRHLEANIGGGSTFAAIVEIKSGSTTGEDHLAPLQAAQTPAIISNRPAPGTNPVELMTFHALGEPGDWTNRNLKISIQDIVRSTNESSEYGSFSVVLRHLSDSDNVVRVIEQFNNCDLNPDSLNYVARKIGDRYEEWNEDERRYVQRGDYDSNSSYIRVAVASDVAAKQTDAALLPFGWRGIVKYDDEASLGPGSLVGAPAGTVDNWVTASFVAGITPNWPLWTTGSTFVFAGEDQASTIYSASVLYPVPELRVSASAGNLSNNTDAYFGYQTTKTPGGTVYDTSNIDLLRPRGGIVADMFAAGASNSTERSMEFTLDDVAVGAGDVSGVWVSGSHNATSDEGAPDGSYTYASGAVSGVLDAGYDRFTVPMYGGFDGTDVLEMDPFSNQVFPVSPNDRTSYTFNSIRRAIDSVADPEVVQMNVASMPGLTNEGLTTNLVRTCEDRADALAVIDLPNGYSPREDGLAAARNNSASTIRQAVNGLRARGLNSSYGCTFYPWVRARDAINGTLVWLPPSVAAIGTFSSSQRKTQVWFAPAGFNRGGLSEGAAGIPVIDVAHQLRRKDRDDLYAANINPIAKFPAEGIVIFGQKTLQVTPSALDRINVRRLMIFVKKRISQMAATILFDPNVKTTWARFTSKVEPFLANVKTNFGLSDYKVILDETTTTAELIDRNILYAQIFLKPTRAIEFIAIDFNITRTGASFDD